MNERESPDMPAPAEDQSDGQEPSLALTGPPENLDPQRCKLHLSITMLEEDGHPQGRRVIIGARQGDDVPIITLTRAPDLLALFPQLQTLLDQLIADLPRRLEIARQRQHEKMSAGPTSRKSRLPASLASPDAVPADKTREPRATAAPASRAAKGSRPAPNDSPFEQTSLFGASN